MPPAADLDDLFERNRRWAAAMERREPGFFTGLLSQQAPQYLWIGCADSRVPANELVDLQPGELFVHRNVANVVAHGDLNCLSVVQFATDVLQVGHIIVVGHSRCGGVQAALHGRRVGLADNWLRYVQDVRDRHAPFLASIAEERRVDALCELNVIEQARNVCETTVVRDAWSRGQPLVVHGWFYGLQNGLLEDLRLTVASHEELEATHAAAIERVHARHRPTGGPAA
jgi:carbonic anhydrase